AGSKSARLSTTSRTRSGRTFSYGSRSPRSGHGCSSGVVDPHDAEPDSLRAMDDLVFAVTWQRKGEPIGQRVNAFAKWLGEKFGCKVVPKVSLSYEELLGAMRREEADLAWLPPIVSAVL